MAPFDYMSLLTFVVLTRYCGLDTFYQMPGNRR